MGWREKRGLPKSLPDPIETTSPRLRFLMPGFVMFLLGLTAVCTGASGIDLHPAAAAVLVPSVTLVILGIAAFWAGMTIERLRAGI